MVHDDPVGLTVPLGGAAAKGLVLLFMGGEGDAGIEPAGKGAVQSPASANFLVRSAQLFAEAGFVAVIIDSPEGPLGPKLCTSNALADSYRRSPELSHDVVKVVSAVRKGRYAHLPIFVVGTSRGAIAAVQLKDLGLGVALPSPAVSAGGALSDFVGRRPADADIEAATLVLSNVGDCCGVSSSNDAAHGPRDAGRAGSPSGSTARRRGPS